MSDSARPEQTAFRDLEVVVRHLADELASFRRRALTAEARVRELEGKDGESVDDASSLASKVDELEQANAALQARLERAAARTQQMLERVRFLRQQARAGGDK